MKTPSGNRDRTGSKETILSKIHGNDGNKGLTVGLCASAVVFSALLVSHIFLAEENTENRLEKDFNSIATHFQTVHEHKELCEQEKQFHSNSNNINRNERLAELLNNVTITTVFVSRGGVHLSCNNTETDRNLHRHNLSDQSTSGISHSHGLYPDHENVSHTGPALR